MRVINRIAYRAASFGHSRMDDLLPAESHACREKESPERISIVCTQKTSSRVAAEL